MQQPWRDAISQVILGNENAPTMAGIRTRRGRHEEGGENIASNGGTPDQIYRARAGLPLRTVQLLCSVQARISRGQKCQTDPSKPVAEQLRFAAGVVEGRKIEKTDRPSLKTILLRWVSNMYRTKGGIEEF